MQLSFVETIGMVIAALAAFMLGSGRLRFNISLYALQAILIALSALLVSLRGELELFIVAAIVLLLNTIGIPLWLTRIADKRGLEEDKGMLLPSSSAMYLSIISMAAVLLIMRQLFGQFATQFSVIPLTASISLLVTGILLMSTRRLALSRFMGFLTLSNGIYFLCITQLKSMPVLLESILSIEIMTIVMAAELMLSRVDSADQLEPPFKRSQLVVGFYSTLALVFASAIAVVICDHLDYMWMGMAILSLLIIVLIYFNGGINAGKTAIQLLFSLGIGLALSLFGIVLISVAGQDYFLTGGGLSVATLLFGAARVPQSFLQAGITFAVLGFAALAVVFALQARRPYSQSVVPAFAMSLILLCLAASPAFVVWKLVNIGKHAYMSN